jgi:hypothetical protein
MSGFAADWLDLREAADAAARSSGLAAALAPWRAQAEAGLRDRPELQVVDLGAGTGANLRYLAPLLGGRQHWTTVDHDPALLTAQALRLCDWAASAEIGAGFSNEKGAAKAALAIETDRFACRIEARQLDLATALDSIACGPATLVTASALLDLVGRSWLAQLIDRICAAQSACLFALSVDGRIELEPALPDDALMRALFNRHQTQDKGFGTALGPAAAATAVQLLEQRGYTVMTAASDWVLGAPQAPLIDALLTGWRAAAVEAEPASAARLDAWHDQRQATLSAAGLRARVGHIDLVAWPQRSGRT